MNQAAPSTSLFARLGAMFNSPAPLPRKLRPGEVAVVVTTIKRIDTLIAVTGDWRPEVLQRMVQQTVVEPLGALHHYADDIEPRAVKCIGDALWELSAIDSIGDTLHPVLDREECATLADGVLDDARSLLQGALRHGTVQP